MNQHNSENTLPDKVKDFSQKLISDMKFFFWPTMIALILSFFVALFFMPDDTLPSLGVFGYIISDLISIIVLFLANALGLFSHCVNSLGYYMVHDYSFITLFIFILLITNNLKCSKKVYNKLSYEYRKETMFLQHVILSLLAILLLNTVVIFFFGIAYNIFDLSGSAFNMSLFEGRESMLSEIAKWQYQSYLSNYQLPEDALKLKQGFFLVPSLAFSLLAALSFNIVLMKQEPEPDDSTNPDKPESL